MVGFKAVLAGFWWVHLGLWVMMENMLSKRLNDTWCSITQCSHLDNATYIFLLQQFLMK